MKVQRIKGYAYVIYSGEWNQPIASAILTEDGEIKAGWVDPGHRRTGLLKQIGKQIFSDIHNGVAKLNPEVTEVIAHCHPGNEAVNELNKSAGWNLWHRWYKKIEM